ncbi:MAG: Mur ligase family protein [Bacteroidota bacterium]
MRIHFIAIGGSIMHSLAIALARQGHTVSGSDDKVYDPAKSKLEAEGLLPEEMGWQSERITDDLDVVILGMHAFSDNPELLKAQELGLTIYSFPEFMYAYSKQKQRMVIAGSYGKSSVTSMIMHVLKHIGKKFDYMVGAQVPGFEQSVSLSEDAPLIVMEGDEYLSSRIDPQPKFLHYKPHILILTGISWDHINVFPSLEEYHEQFNKLLATQEKASSVIYAKDDKVLKKMVEKNLEDEVHYPIPFSTPKYKVKDGTFTLSIQKEKTSLEVIGEHNMRNMAAAWEACRLVGVELNDFLDAVSSFQGANSRLQTISSSSSSIVYKDYAHAPAKVEATVKAVREQYPSKNLIACLELHTFSSLTKSFLPQYKGSLDPADGKLVYINPETVKAKRLEAISEAELQQAFGSSDITLLEKKEDILPALKGKTSGDDVILMMSSGTFSGLDLKEIG